MPSEAGQKKIMEKLNRAQKCSILGPQNLGSGGPGPRGPPWIRTWLTHIHVIKRITHTAKLLPKLCSNSKEKLIQLSFFVCVAINL